MFFFFFIVCPGQNYMIPTTGFIWEEKEIYMLSQWAFGNYKQRVRREKKRKEHIKNSFSHKLSSNSETEAGNGVTRGQSHLAKL